MGANNSTDGINLHFGRNLIKQNDHGVQKSAFGGDEQMNTIFEHFDQDRNGILDRTELQEMYAKLNEDAGNSRMSKGEARGFLRKCGIEDASRSESRNILQKFLSFIGNDEHDNVFSADRNNDGDVTVMYYDDGSVKNRVDMYTHQEDNSSLLSRRIYDNNGMHVENIYDNGVLLYQDQTTKFDPNNTPYDELLPDDITQITKRFNVVDGNTQNSSLGQEIFLNSENETVCTRNYTYDDAGNMTLMQQFDAEGNPTARFEYDGNANLTREEVTDEDGVVTIKDYTQGEDPVVTTQTPLGGDNNTVKTTDQDGNVLSLSHGNFSVNMERDNDGNVISHARAGETFDQTASRLGFDKVTNPEGYAAFVEANGHAGGGTGKRGWFRLNQNVIIPQDHLSELDIANYGVDPQAELAVYRESGVRPGADNTEAVRKQRQRNNALNATNKLVEEFVNANPKPEVKTYTDRLGNPCKEVVIGNQEIRIITDIDDGSHKISIVTDASTKNADNSETQNRVHYENIDDYGMPEALWADDNDDNSLGSTHTGNNTSSQTMVNMILNQLFDGQWPEQPSQ